MTALRQIVLAAIAVGSVLLLSERAARAETLGIKEFNDKLKQWKSEERAPSPFPLTVEGRVSLYSRDRLRYRNCEVLFLSKGDLPSRMQKSSSANVEVTGRVVVDKLTGGYVFQIEMVRETDADLDRFRELRRKIRPETPEKLYELARWAQERGAFYKDDELLARSAEAFERGLDLERQALVKDRPEGILELAQRAKTHRLPSKLRQELVHEAWFRLWERDRKKPAQQLEELAAAMAQQLPGCTEPLGGFPAESKAYHAKPLETYAAADSDLRRRIHRVLYCDVLLETITRKLAKDGGNGFDIADQIDELVPERHALAEKYRKQALDARAAEVEHLAKGQMLEVAAQYRERGEAREAGRLIESWLALRLRALEPDDTEGVLQLSEEYRRLLKRHDLADRLLVDAWKRNPKAADLIERLNEAGYHLVEGNWISDADFKNIPEGQMEPAIRAGKVEIGMNASQVRRSRAGSPDGLSRIVTAGLVTEVWTYHLSDGSQLVVRLVKRAGQGDFSVVAVSQVSAE